MAASAAAAPFAFGETPAAASITAGEILDRIQARIGVGWKPESADGLKAGDRSAAATGIVTTSLATLDVLQRAVRSGANVVMTSGTTFYSRADTRNPAWAADPICTRKDQFINQHRLVIFRLSEHWRLRTPDPLGEGLLRALGWTRYRSAGDPMQARVPDITLERLAEHVKNRLGARGGVRVVGDPRLRVSRVGLLPGTTPIQASIRLLPQVDVLVAGEVREWETVEYARDKAFTKQNKGLILVGRVLSEEPGMSACANWLKTFVPEVPVRHIAAGDPYWRPA